MFGLVSELSVPQLTLGDETVKFFATWCEIDNMTIVW